MPIIQFDGSVMSKDQKAKLVKKLTDAAVEVTGIPEQGITVIIRESHMDNVAIGGKLISDAMPAAQSKD